MSTQMIDNLARRAGVMQDRRTSLKALGGVALLAVAAAPRSAQAKPSAGKKAKKRCKKQVAPCQTALASLCQPSPTFDLCLAKAAECCGHLATCDVTPMMTCLIGGFIV